MRARQADNVLGGVFYQLVFVVLGLLVLELADAAFVMVRFLLSQQELEQRKECEWDVGMHFFIAFFFFFHVQSEQVADGFVERMIFFDSISLMQLHSVDTCFECDTIFVLL